MKPPLLSALLKLIVNLLATDRSMFNTNVNIHFGQIPVKFFGPIPVLFGLTPVQKILNHEI